MTTIRVVVSKHIMETCLGCSNIVSCTDYFSPVGTRMWSGNETSSSESTCKTDTLRPYQFDFLIHEYGNSIFRKKDFLFIINHVRCYSTVYKMSDMSELIVGWWGS